MYEWGYWDGYDGFYPEYPYDWEYMAGFYDGDADYWEWAC